MQRTSIDKELKAAAELKLAVRTYLEYFCRTGKDIRMALDHLHQHIEIAGRDTCNKTYGIRAATIEDAVHKSDAAPVWNNNTTTESFTHREGVKG